MTKFCGKSIAIKFCYLKFAIKILQIKFAMSLFRKVKILQVGSFQVKICKILDHFACRLSTLF